MGFFFALIILLPTSLILLILWMATGNKIYGKILGIMWLIIFGLIIIGTIRNVLTSNKVLKKSDYYGSYIIDRNFFAGQNADWQYNKYRFEIKNNDSIYFYVTNGKTIIKTYTGVITTVNPYGSERLVIKMTQPTHHILNTNPTIYREPWNFYLVFNSPLYHNMYFRHGTWEEIKSDK
jgi:hypothetical protein